MDRPGQGRLRGNLQIEAGLKSRTQAIAERGYDAEQVDREIAAERKREAELGLDFWRPGSPAQVTDGISARTRQRTRQCL
jgi:capsid protein